MKKEKGINLKRLYALNSILISIQKMMHLAFLLIGNQCVETHVIHAVEDIRLNVWI